MQELLAVMRQLRAPGGCPWDQEQTHETLRPYLLEEAAEAADAIGTPELPDELGDVLLQVAFHSVIAEEQGSFDYTTIEQGIVQKLIRRHPHVFGDLKVSGSDEVTSNWQAIKTAERHGKPRSAAEQVSSSLGALAREAKAQQLTVRLSPRQRNAQQTSSAQPDATKPAKTQLLEAIAAAPPTETGIAEVLSAVVNWARSLNIDAEIALRARTNSTLAALDELPDEAKND